MTADDAVLANTGFLHESLCSQGLFVGMPWGEMMIEANIPLIAICEAETLARIDGTSVDKVSLTSLRDVSFFYVKTTSKG